MDRPVFWHVSTLALLALCSPSISAETPAAAAITHYIRIGYLPATHDTLLFIADQEKLFPPNLTVQLVRYTSSPDILNDLRGDRVDVGIPGVAAPINFIAGGSPFKLVAGAAQESAAVVVRRQVAEKMGVQDSSLAEKLKGISGMHIGSVKLSTGDALFRKALRDNKVDLDLNDSYRDPKILLTDLYGEKLDGAVLWSPHMTAAEKEGMVILFWLGEVLPNHVCCRQVVRTDYLVESRESVVLYLKGLIRAMLFYDDPSNKSRVLIDVQHFVLNPPEVLEKELYGERRTKLSVDLNRSGIEAYLEAMKSSTAIDDNQRESVRRSIEAGPLIDAYRQLGLSDEDAATAASMGFDTVKKRLRAAAEH